MMALVGSPLARAPQFLLQDVWRFITGTAHRSCAH
jgi:hypothetical protein